MSDVVKRTIFFDDSDGHVRFHDWAMVTHSLGVMMEPFTNIATKGFTCGKAGITNYDATEAGCRIDAIHIHSLDKGLSIVGNIVTGGNLVPREGR